MCFFESTERTLKNMYNSGIAGSRKKLIGQWTPETVLVVTTLLSLPLF